MAELVAEARKYFLNLKLSTTNLKLKLTLGGLEVLTVECNTKTSLDISFQSVTDMLGFEPSRFASTALDASVDGALQTPLDNFLRAQISDRLEAAAVATGDKSVVRALRKELNNRQGCNFALRRKQCVYPLAVLHSSPEVLCDPVGGHGDAELLFLPRVFPWSKDVNPHLDALGFFFRAQYQYYAVVDNVTAMRNNMSEALTLMESAHKAEPTNAWFVARHAAVLVKLGRKKEVRESVCVCVSCA